MSLFTVIMDYDGGTFVSQTRARSIDELPACIGADIAWGTVFDRPRVDSRRRYIAALSDSEPTAVVGLTNVWCMSALFGRKLAVLHIVQTMDTKDTATRRTKGSARETP